MTSRPFSFTQIWANTYSLWDNPVSNAASETMRAYNHSIKTRASSLPIVDFFRNEPYAETASLVASLLVMPVSLTARFIYRLGEQCLHTAALPAAMGDVDALTKTATFVSGLAKLCLKQDHPFPQLLDSGIAGLGGFLCAKHLPSLFVKREFLKIWNKEEKRIDLKYIYIAFFQAAHFCQLPAYLQKCGFIDLQQVAANIGMKVPLLKPVVDGVWNIGTSKFKNYLAVLGALFAVATVVDTVGRSYFKFYKETPQGKFSEFLKVINGKAVDLYTDFVNNLTKAYVIHAFSAGWAVTTTLIVASNILGITNQSKNAKFAFSSQADVESNARRFAEIWKSGQIPHDVSHIDQNRQEVYIGFLDSTAATTGAKAVFTAN